MLHGRNLCERALRALENVGVDSKSILIKNKLQHLPVRKLKRIYARLNEIRKFIGLNDLLKTNKTEVNNIAHIKIDELYKILDRIQDSEIKTAIASLFATGCRLGELLALSETDLLNGYIIINKQLKKDGTISPPKRGKIGKVIIIQDLSKYVYNFLTIPNKQVLRNKLQSALVDVSKTVLNRHIHIHDLRHSHAIYLLNKGASLTLISLQLRNGIEVCQKYYAGFCHTDDTLEILKKIANHK